MFGNVKKPYRQSGHHPSDSQCSKRLCVFWVPRVASEIEVYVHIYPHMNLRLISIPTRNDPVSK